MRVFIAVEIPEDVQTTLDLAIKQLKSRIKSNSLRWVQARSIHITLKFLGEVPVTRLPDLTGLLKDQAAGFAPFDILVGGLGAFPSAQKPRVLWIGIDAPAAMAQLQKGIERGAIQLGFPAEARAFTPHLTLARVSEDASPDELHQIGAVLAGGVNPIAPGSPAVFHADAVHLIRSDLRPTGAVYTRVVSVPLEGLGVTGNNKPAIP